MSTKRHVLNQVSLAEITVEPVRRSVGLLGGGFNPIHMGHLIMADQVYHQLGLEEFYLMPSYESPHVDSKKVIDSDHRVAMLSLAIDTHSHVQLELTEIERQGKSYTYDTMTSLIAANPDVDYYLVIGGDMVEYLPKWHKIDELMEMVQFVGVKRPGFTYQSDYPIIWVDAPMIDLSSTDIRKKVEANESIKYLVPDNVLEYIQDKGLYRHE